MERNILIIDDDTSITAILSFILNQSDYRTFIASSSKEAINMIHSSQEFSMVLLDVKIPKMSGVNLLKKISLLKPTLPVIAMTKEINTLALKEIFDSGFYGILYKPFDIEEVLEIINLIAKNKVTN